MKILYILMLLASCNINAQEFPESEPVSADVTLSLHLGDCIGSLKEEECIKAAYDRYYVVKGDRDGDVIEQR